MEWKTVKQMLDELVAELCKDYCKYADLPDDIHQEICKNCPASFILGGKQ